MAVAKKGERNNCLLNPVVEMSLPSSFEINPWFSSQIGTL